MDRFENAALYRQEMRSEHQITAESAFARQRCLQLGQMAMRVANRVGTIILRDFAEQQLALRIASGAGDTRRRIDDDLA